LKKPEGQETANPAQDVTGTVQEGTGLPEDLLEETGEVLDGLIEVTDIRAHPEDPPEVLGTEAQDIEIATLVVNLPR
jgi:hypothetical protein